MTMTPISVFNSEKNKSIPNRLTAIVSNARHSHLPELVASSTTLTLSSVATLTACPPLRDYTKQTEALCKLEQKYKPNHG